MDMQGNHTKGKNCIMGLIGRGELMSDPIELRTCPFCGYRAELLTERIEGKEASYVECQRCLARGEFFFVSPKYASEERAIEAWNRRAGKTDVHT